FGSRTTTLPLAFALSLTLIVFLPYFTITVPFGFARPAALTRTTSLARLLAVTFFFALTLTVTFGLPLATLFDDDDTMPSRCPGRLAVTRTETRLRTSFFLSLYFAEVAPLMALPLRNHW